MAVNESYVEVEDGEDNDSGGHTNEDNIRFITQGWPNLDVYIPIVPLYEFTKPCLGIYSMSVLFIQIFSFLLSYIVCLLLTVTVSKVELTDI